MIDLHLNLKMDCSPHPTHLKARDWQPKWNQSCLSRRAHLTVKCDPENSPEKPSSSFQDKKKVKAVWYLLNLHKPGLLPPLLLSISGQMNSQCQQNFTYVMQKHINRTQRKDINNANWASIFKPARWHTGPHLASWGLTVVTVAILSMGSVQLEWHFCKAEI